MDIIDAQCLVIGSGPGGYAAAFRAADLGLSVVLVERFSTLGGVCLNVGCIPSKSFLHVAELYNEIPHFKDFGIKVSKQELDLDKMLSFKESVVAKLTGGLGMLAKKRKIKVIQGNAKFVDASSVDVESEDGSVNKIIFEKCVVATGSRPIKLPFLPDDPRIFDSTGALDLSVRSGKMLIIGGGIIGCEMATIYNAIGMDVVVVEMTDQIMGGADEDLVKPCQKILENRGVEFYLKTKVENVKSFEDGLEVSFSGKFNQMKKFDSILESVGRVPNSDNLSLDLAGVDIDSGGFVIIDKKSLQTSNENIYAIGDIVGNPMLAHKSSAQGRCAAEIIAGEKVLFDAKAVPSVAYTDPEIAWVGLTENECSIQGIEIEKGVFPWAANGRSLCYGRTEGFTKIIADASTGRVLGAGIVGRNAGDLIAEFALAIEMGCDVEDISLTIHAHPTLAETSQMASEACQGTLVDLYMPKKPKFKEKH